MIPSSKNTSKRSSVDIGETKEVEVLKRKARFRETLIQRDNGCVITQCCLLDYLVASHIIAFAYWKEQNKGDLPVNIQRIIECFEYEINDVQNGLLLESTLSVAFDLGDIAFRKCDGGHCVVSINPWFSEYEGEKVGD